MLIICCRNQLY